MPAARVAVPPPVATQEPVVSEQKDAAAVDTTEPDDENGTVGKKRRGIRLKQDLD
jgi:hypothetical protein